MDPTKSIKALFKELAKVGLSVSLVSDFYPMILLRTHEEGSLHTALLKVWGDTNLIKFKIKPIETKQADKKKAQKAAISRKLYSYGFGEIAVKMMLRDIYRNVKDGRGGLRENAGRKTTIDANDVTLSLDDETLRFLKFKGDGNMSAAVRLLCKEDKERMILIGEPIDYDD